CSREDLFTWPEGSEPFQNGLTLAVSLYVNWLRASRALSSWTKRLEKLRRSTWMSLTARKSQEQSQRKRSRSRPPKLAAKQLPLQESGWRESAEKQTSYRPRS